MVRRVDATGKELAKRKERGDRGQRWIGSLENHFCLSRTIHTANSAETIFNPGLGLPGRDGTKVDELPRETDVQKLTPLDNWENTASPAPAPKTR